MENFNSRISPLAIKSSPSVQLTRAGKVAVIRRSDSCQRAYLIAVIPVAGIVYTAMTTRFVGGDYFSIISRIVEGWPF
jgi:hypothetical protein